MTPGVERNGTAQGPQWPARQTFDPLHHRTQYLLSRVRALEQTLRAHIRGKRGLEMTFNGAKSSHEKVDTLQFCTVPYSTVQYRTVQ